MSVLPYRANVFVDHKSISQFLLACQQNCRIKSCTQLVSISLEIELVDPLSVLQLAKRDELSFYFENRGKGEAIAAIDAVVKLQLEGSKNRFYQAQKFINLCLANTLTVGISDELFAGPHFFCSFSFFDEPAQADYPFPSATVFLPRCQVATRRDRCILVTNLVISAEISIEIVVQQLSEKIEIIRSSQFSSNRANNYRQKLIKQPEENLDNFKQTVLSSLASIDSSNLSLLNAAAGAASGRTLSKIVIAQALDVSSHSPFKLFQSLNNLRMIHPDCYIFSISNGKGQNFIGASPERLISIRNQKLTTDALAGSAPRGKTAAEEDDLENRLLSSEKEKREHQVVIDFIIQRLYKLGLVPQKLPLQLRQLSNIQHLWTPIQAKVPTSVQPLEIVAELHPTPAVAGAARDIACAEIRRYESFERGLYAAPLGWIDHRNNSEFIVGIRSALIDGDRARLYAGAGIVAGSDPDKELAEIQLKLQALLKALI